MIGVVMGEQNGLHRPDSGGKELGAHIGTRIHQKPLPLIAFDQDRGPRPPIPWFGWVAGAPIAPAIGAADQGHPGRTTAAKDTDRDQALVARSLLSVPDSSVNRPTKNRASGARAQFWIGKGQHESHH